MSHTSLYIAGELVPSVQGAHTEAINPSTQEVIGHIALATEADLELALQAAREALRGWQFTSGHFRATILRAIGHKILEQKAALAELEARDCGKVLDEAVQDMDDAAACLEQYAVMAEELDTSSSKHLDVGTPDFAVQVRKEPFGVVGLFTTWNYPLLIAVWKIAPALAAGNTVVHKPSEKASLSCMELARMCSEVGLPPGVLNILTGKDDLGAAMSKHPGFAKVSFTGSTAVGRSVAAACAANLVPCTLELGGKGAILVFDDASIDHAVEWVMFGAFWVNGQCCSATSRLLIHSDIAPQFLQRLVKRAQDIKVDDAMSPGARLGPLVSASQLHRVQSYIQSGMDEGAHLLTGGLDMSPCSSGFFVPPTVFADVKQDHKIWREEIFGPVLCCMVFNTEEDAIRLANDSDFGLAGAVISADPARCERVARQLECGIVWVNCSQPCFLQAPWGGRKQSGYGRELGVWGLHNYLQEKQVCSYVSPKIWDWYQPDA